jgi:hypothetical protein|tara:strand:- start:3506 stop:3937 length:432 start_codon:yes stop_codon:yes gene_type:complete
MNITEAINALVAQWLAEAESEVYWDTVSDERVTNITIDNIRYYINNGNCEQFAEIICEQIEGAEAWWGDMIGEEDDDFWGLEDIENWVEDHAYAHCFIVYKGRYYDSEAPEGVDHPKDLPLYQKHQILARTNKWEYPKAIQVA